MENDKLNALSKGAFAGTLDLDALPPVEYKYLSRVSEVGRRVRADAITQVQAATLTGQYFAEYQTERAAQDECEAANKFWCDCIRMTNSLRVHINGSNDPAFVASAACRAVYEMTRDTAMLAKSEEMAKRVEEVQG